MKDITYLVCNKQKIFKIMKITKIRSFKFNQLKTENELIKNIENMGHLCSFCGTLVNFDYSDSENFFQKLCKEKNYCLTCLRQDYGSKNDQYLNNIFMFGLNSIFFKYYNYYPSKISLSEIKEIILNHARIGLKNPIFSYNSLNFMWFVDFNKIDNNFIEIQIIENTIKEIINCATKKMETKQTRNEIKKKYINALNKFNKKRTLNKPFVISMNAQEKSAEKVFYFSNLIKKLH